jgi:hypothetical protein
MGDVKKSKTDVQTRTVSVGSVGKIQNSQIIRPLIYLGKVGFLSTLPTLSLHSLNISFVYLGMLNSSTDFCLFFSIYYGQK